MSESPMRLGTICRNYCVDVFQQTSTGWNRFWFSPADPAALGVIRILAGLMLLYTQLVWMWSSTDFFGPQSWLPSETVRSIEPGSYSWSHLHGLNSPLPLMLSHLTAITAALALTLGLWTRPAAILTFLMTVSYNHRVPGALYGLDQVNTFLAFYLTIGPSGACYSLDRWFKNRAGMTTPTDRSVGANLAIRLMQVHLCVIYLFAGLSKLQGASWWDGSAFWGGVASLEYQSLDLTWLSGWPLTVNFITHVTVFWEVSYCVLVWNRFTRPIVLLLAICVHGGIALALGMKTFGVAMIFANLSFVSPQIIRALLHRRAQVQILELLNRSESSSDTPAMSRKLTPPQQITPSLADAKRRAS